MAGAACLVAVLLGTGMASVRAADDAAESKIGSTEAAKEMPNEASVSEKAFGKWTLQCLPESAPDPRCQIVHRLMSEDGKQSVLVLSLARTSDGATKLQMALPLGFSIQEGVRIVFGGGFATIAGVSRCTVQGCLVEGDGAPEMIAAMKAEKQGAVTVRTMQGEEIALPVSLDGFSEAYAQLQPDG